MAAIDADDTVLHEPPERIVELDVIARIAYSAIKTVAGAESQADVGVPARSLRRALSAAIEDDEAQPPRALR